MDPAEFMRLVDSISRDRGLDKNLILDDIEKALVQAASKRFDQTGDFTLTIDRETGEIRAFEDDQPVALERLGRIVANVAKQVIMQRLREGERDILFDEYIKRLHTIVNGTILRVERGMVIVQMGRAEAILPREEQIPGEIYRPGAVVPRLPAEGRQEGPARALGLVAHPRQLRPRTVHRRDPRDRRRPDRDQGHRSRARSPHQDCRGIARRPRRSSWQLRWHARIAHHQDRRRTWRREDRYHSPGPKSQRSTSSTRSSRRRSCRSATTSSATAPRSWSAKTNCHWQSVALAKTFVCRLA